MQLASLNSDGSPVVCNVWYDAHFRRMFFALSHDTTASTARTFVPTVGPLAALWLFHWTAWPDRARRYLILRK
jgi:hypothetical protein